MARPATSMHLFRFFLQSSTSCRPCPPKTPPRSSQQLGQPPDNAVGAGRRIRRETLPVAVVPDRMDAEALGCRHFPFKIVANHPGFRGLNPEHRHCMPVGTFFRLAETVLALDLHMIEAMLKGEADQLGAL